MFHLYFLGDLNCRIGTPIHESIKYIPNIDKTINTNGMRLLEYLKKESSLVIINGCITDDKIFDSKFTFYRGNTRSQNDLVLSNVLHTIDSFVIMDKLIYSDHVPTSTIINIIHSFPLDILKNCANGIFNDDHYDINKRKIPTLKFSKINWIDAINQLQIESLQISNRIQNSDIDNDQLNVLITSTIYDTCRKHYKTQNEDNTLPSNLMHCNSRNYKAIAEINLWTYNIHSNNGDSMEICKPFLENFLRFEQLALEAENREVNTRRNTAWKSAKQDGKKMWEMIDWKGNADTKKEILINESEITPYFQNIFQSEKTENHPKISDIEPNLESYQRHIPFLDNLPQRDELCTALNKLGSGTGLDGIPSSVVKLLPRGIMDNILILLQRTFNDTYPKQWEKQILNAIAKSGHTSESPKLRGIAIAPILARLYDCILDQRFRNWYIPNREQAGFRSGQGCLLQLFIVMLLIHYTKIMGKEFFIAFLDYEKAFDYANRAIIINKLMVNGCGSKFIKAIAKMYRSTTYIPMSNNKLLNEIVTSYGVAQGRHTSPNLYSFLVSDMPQCTNEILREDFMDPFNIAQLADDTITLAEKQDSLVSKIRCLLEYSQNIYQVPNLTKTFFCHFSNNPSLDPIQINRDISIASVNVKKGYKYLGMKFIPTNDINKIIDINMNERINNVCKFYSWLEVNDETPIEIKLLVLDSCIFNSILYGIETWGNIGHIEQKLRLIEQKALKAILKVKKGTSTDLIYNELKRPDIISKIKDLQWKFYHRIRNLNDDVALVKSYIHLCNDTPMIEYYNSLSSTNKSDNIRNREQRILESDSSMLQYYASITNIELKSRIYSNFVDDRKMAIITRWRLSNHKLLIETGRYSVQSTPREDRKCTICHVLENESHVIYTCPEFKNIQQKYTNILNKYPRLILILNPDIQDIYIVSELISEIDDILNNR